MAELIPGNEQDLAWRSHGFSPQLAFGALRAGGEGQVVVALRAIELTAWREAAADLEILLLPAARAGAMHPKEPRRPRGRA